MANTYVIGLSEVYAKDYSGTQKVYQIDVNVSSGGSPVSGLGSKFIILKNGTSFTSFTATAGTGNAWILAITSGSEFLTDDNVTIQVSNDPDYSDSLYVDFAQGYTSHEATYSYKLPSEAGTYSIKLDKVSGADFSTATPSDSFILSDKNPSPANSSVKISKPYLAKFVGTTMGVIVTLNNATNDASSGPYETSFFADLA